MTCHCWLLLKSVTACDLRKKDITHACRIPGCRNIHIRSCCLLGGAYPHNAGHAGMAHQLLSTAEVKRLTSSNRSLSLYLTGLGRMSKSPLPLSGPSSFTRLMMPMKKPLLLDILEKLASEKRCTAHSASPSVMSAGHACTSNQDAGASCQRHDCMHTHGNRLAGSAARQDQEITFKGIHGGGVNVTAMTVASVDQAF